ncbi:hypothetical protein BESB_006200 [Besnoitia besnoiti]|uniref:Cytochrome b n=1 Tax=Besnoitia besnoiti TaxID=94643 RepID=A0A2A9MK29_BESBE|nr:hypothetical protein BESB_006200 [Besnoitia besnoiti]PFH38279.1 hypothetical protein BESB_006200 [Besnoitia besnoiti]
MSSREHREGATAGNASYVELSHPDNSIPVNRFVTPLHIVPEWYFLAYYAVLKVIPSKTRKQKSENNAMSHGFCTPRRTGSQYRV